jgi:hypothetical protein
MARKKIALSLRLHTQMMQIIIEMTGIAQTITQ